MIDRSLEQVRTNLSADRGRHPSRHLKHDELCHGGSRNSGPRRLVAQKNYPAAEDWPAQVAISLIQGKWKMQILVRLQHGPVRLGELCRNFPDASKKMLTQHLREMERDGLIVRKDLSGKLRHVEYTLSDPLGPAVIHLIRTLRIWGLQNLDLADDTTNHPYPIANCVR